MTYNVLSGTLSLYATTTTTIWVCAIFVMQRCLNCSGNMGGISAKQFSRLCHVRRPDRRLTG